MTYLKFTFTFGCMNLERAVAIAMSNFYSLKQKQTIDVLRRTKYDSRLSKNLYFIYFYVAVKLVLSN